MSSPAKAIYFGNQGSNYYKCDDLKQFSVNINNLYLKRVTQSSGMDLP